MSHFEREGFRVRVCGSSGSAVLPGYYQPGVVMADPYGGPGGSYHFELCLYEDGPRLVAAVTCVTFEYAESREVRPFVSADGGQSLQEVPGGDPAGRLVQTLVIDR
jgi:hypothetical protein